MHSVELAASSWNELQNCSMQRMSCLLHIFNHMYKQLSVTNKSANMNCLQEERIFIVECYIKSISIVDWQFSSACFSRFSETSVLTKAAWHNIPEDGIHQTFGFHSTIDFVNISTMVHLPLSLRYFFSSWIVGLIPSDLMIIVNSSKVRIWPLRAKR
jgi:hypothetical protein